jgi:TDG/mug DNA glycosylase family protein
MIRYHYKRPRILFVGINPHYGSFRRGVPFSNNKTLWYLLSQAGLIDESREELRDDARLKKVYEERFNPVYRYGFINVIHRATRDITQLAKGEELPGRKQITRIIRAEKPRVACFIGKIAYQKYSGEQDVRFGWNGRLGNTRLFVMHFPLRGAAAIRVRELRAIKAAAA